MMIVWIKAHWKLVLIGVGILILLIWIGSITGTNRKLYNMALDNLRKDQSQVIQEKDEQLKAVREQNRLYQSQIKEVQKEKEIIKLRADQSVLEVQKLKGENNALQKQLKDIIVSSDPDIIISDLNKAGFKSIRRRGANKP